MVAKFTTSVCISNLYAVFSIIADNPLDCSSCKLADFQKWLKSSIQLDLHSKQAAKCRTPTKFSNAVINDIADFECTAAGDLVIDPTTDYPAVATDLETRVSAADQDKEAFNRVAGMADMSQNTTLVLRSETFNDVKHIAKFSLLPSGELKSFSCHQIKAYCRGQQVFNQACSLTIFLFSCHKLMPVLEESE